MNGEAAAVGAKARWSLVWSVLSWGIVGVARGLVFFGLALLGLLPLAGIFALVVYGADVANELSGRTGGPDPSKFKVLPLVLLVGSIPFSRLLARLTRRLTGRWCGVAISTPYRPPLPPADEPTLTGELGRRASWLLRDPAILQDLLWLAVDAFGGCLLVAAPAALVGYGLANLVLPVTGYGFHIGGWYLSHSVAHGPWIVPVGLLFMAVGLLTAPVLLTAYGALARSVLGPTRSSELAQRVTHLAKTRSDTLDASAVALRRIERDLHDGAQARLVATGMTLEVADQLLDTDPTAARALLIEAKNSSAKALAELRDLVRGIHPPVLADRGLVAAISALALDSPVRVQLDGDLPGRPSPPVESAVYFAVSELLANVSKHAQARRVWIDLRYDRGLLRIGVTDDGVGGADSTKGSGLRGIERRLAAFDGVLAVSSPVGGPTVVNLEIPCELSSPKTFSY